MATVRGCQYSFGGLLPAAMPIARGWSMPEIGMQDSSSQGRQQGR